MIDSQCRLLAVTRDARTNDEVLFDLAYISYDRTPCRWNGPAKFVESGNLEKAAEVCYDIGADFIFVDVEKPDDPALLRMVRRSMRELKLELSLCGCPFRFLPRKRWLSYLPPYIPREAVGKHHTAEALLYAVILSKFPIDRNALTVEAALCNLNDLYRFDIPEVEAVL